MSTRTVTAIYDSESDAARARAQLLAGGVSEPDVQIISGTLERREGADTEHEKTLWDSLAEFVIEMEDRAMYSEGLRRGGALLTVRVDDREADAVIAALESTDPIDLDERAEQWRTEGWSPDELPPPSMSGYAAGSGPTTETVEQQLRLESGIDAEPAPSSGGLRRRVRYY